ncbi:TetR/AcrR family transcriptional regulator [Leadbetterella sp. DM7]|uniref:TetR/AcrR family transcriptional regulator n=1 Tax=Leadbetterella sp. DM7 TaxID=3235085 RepID=UPI00349ED4D7
MSEKEENILLHAERLFAQNGFNGTSTREIAAAAEVNISMLSYYFGSKEKLLEKIFEFRMKQGLDYAYKVLETPEYNTFEKLMRIVDQYIEKVQKNRNFHQIFQRELLNQKNEHTLDYLRQNKRMFLQIYEKLIEEGHQSCIFTKRPHPAFLQSTVAGTLFNSINSLPIYKEFYRGDDTFDTEYIQQLKDHIKNILTYLLGYEQVI